MQENTAPTSGLPDFRARDEAVVINTYTTVLRRESVPHHVFRAYWRDVHGPLCSRVPGLGWYVQHHFAREQDAHLWPPVDGVSPLPGYVLDGMVEIGFTSTEDQSTFQDASPILFSDEQNVFDETIAYALPRGSTTYRDLLPDATPNGDDVVDRLHVHLSPRPGLTQQLHAFVRDELAPMLAASPAVLKLRTHLPEHYDNTTPAPPAPNVAHTVVDERADLAILEIAFTDPLARRAFLDSDAFAATTATQSRLLAHVTVFPVTGVYTYVRDTELTDAGLRGSRAAELITALAATNQISSDVRHLIGTGTTAPPQGG